MAEKQGMRGMGQLETEARLARDVAAAIKLLDGDSTPWLVMLNELGTLDAKAIKVEVLEDALVSRFDTLASSLAADATTMVVSNYKRFTEGSIVIINGSEQVRVSATPTTSTVTIERAYGNTNKAASSGDKLIVINEAIKDGSDIGDAVSSTVTAPHNFVQNFARPFKVTIQAQQVDTFGANDLDHQAMKAMLEIKKDVEYSLLVASRKQDTTNVDQPAHVAGGLLYFVTDRYDAGGAMTEPWFDDKLSIVSRYGGNHVLLGSRAGMQCLNAFGKQYLKMTPADKVYGLQMQDYRHFNGQLRIKQHNLLENASITDASGLGGTMVIVNMDNVRIKKLPGLWFKRYDMGPAQHGGTYTKGVIYASGCLSITQQETHLVMTGVK